MLLTAVLLFCAHLSEAEGYVTSRPKIVGGTEVTDRSEFAYQAILYLYGLIPYCGGTLIDERNVLTAAHCIVVFDDEPLLPSEVYVGLGMLKLSEPADVRAVRNVYVHENYNPYILQQDIGILQLAESFDTWTENIRPISLKTDDTIDGTCIVSGWGTTEHGLNQMNENLLYAEVPIVDWNECQAAYTELSDKGICAGTSEKDSCQGDSGGPLVCSGKLAGIVSYGDGCAKEGYPGVYTEVAKYLDWIEYYISLSSTVSTTSSTSINTISTSDSTTATDDISTTASSTSADNSSSTSKTAFPTIFTTSSSADNSSGTVTENTVTCDTALPTISSPTDKSSGAVTESTVTSKTTVPTIFTTPSSAEFKFSSVPLICLLFSTIIIGQHFI